MFELHVYPVLGDRDITTITRRDILALLDALEAKGLGAGANRVLANIASLFSWAIQRGIIEASPVASVKPPAVEQPRDRVLNDAEIVAFWHACDLVVGEPFAAILKTLLLLGQRRSEVSAARWAEFDLGEAEWRLPSARAKNGRPHLVPLAPPVLALIEALPSRSSSCCSRWDTSAVHPPASPVPSNGATRRCARSWAVSWYRG